MKSLEDRFWSKVIIQPGCWKWFGAKKDGGYGVLGKGRRNEGLIRATHVSWIYHNGPITEGLIIRQSCDNPECCNPQHLLLGTYKDNMQDCLDRGRAYRNPNYGEQHHSTKLTDEQLKVIQEEWKLAPPKRHGRVAYRNRLAKQFNVTDTTIKAVVAGTARRFKHHD